MIELKAEYNGHEIKWEDYDRVFKISIDGAEIKRLPTVEACEKYIDQKTKQKFKRVPIFLMDRYSRDVPFAPCEATSVIDKHYIWVSGKSGRSKQRFSDVILDTEANRRIIQDINLKNKEILNCRDAINTLEKSAEKLTAEMMIEE